MLQTQTTPHFQLVNSLARIRQEWQEAASGNSLLEVEGNMGMLLADLINGMGLGPRSRLTFWDQTCSGKCRVFCVRPFATD